jgi:hypothetical protein
MSKMTTQPTALKPLMSASTMARSRGSALASRKTRNSRSSRSTTIGNALKMTAAGVISKNPTQTTKKSDSVWARRNERRAQVEQ